MIVSLIYDHISFFLSIYRIFLEKLMKNAKLKSKTIKTYFWIFYI